MQLRTNRVVDALREHRQAIAQKWFDAVAARAKGRATAAENQGELAPILSALINGLRDERLDAASSDFDELRALLAEYSRSRARQGFSPSETAVAVFALKDAVFSILQEDQEAYADFPAFSRFIDDLGLVTIEAYAQAREAIITEQAEQLLELSTPVVRLWDGVVAVPLVGTLDSGRTQIVMETLLETLVATGSSQAIIDITGVPAVDTQVAQHLLKTVLAARLMGAECVISGIRPQIAQTVVDLGIEFGDIVTKASLADALKLTLQRMGLEVRRTEKRV